MVQLWVPEKRDIGMGNHKLGLNQPARYQIEVIGHVDNKRATWFSEVKITNSYLEDGTPITVMKGEVLDQAMLHGLIEKIRDLGLPLHSINRIKST